MLDNDCMAACMQVTADEQILDITNPTDPARVEPVKAHSSASTPILAALQQSKASRKHLTEGSPGVQEQVHSHSMKPFLACRC